MSERQRKIRIGPLNTIGGVVTEMAKVYRQARRGDDLEIEDATRLINMLAQMRSALEVAALEARIGALEAMK